MRKTVYFLAAVSSLATLAFLFATGAVAAPYEVCRVPPVAGVSTKPNILVVMDYSGSMQFGAYTGIDSPCCTTGGYVYDFYQNSYGNIANLAYDKRKGYYGIFDSDKYYRYNKSQNYWEPAPTQPVTRYSVTKVEGTGTGTNGAHDPSNGMWVTMATTPSPAYVAKVVSPASDGTIVVITGLTRNAHLNGKPFEVLEVSGNRFRIQAKFLGDKWDDVNDVWIDPEDYSQVTVIDRVFGAICVETDAVCTGLSGDILNYFTSSRIDTALRALTGGRADCVGTSSCEQDCDTKDCLSQFCYLKGQSSRAYMRETTNFKTDWYVRPATTIVGSTPSGVTYPNDWNTSSTVEGNLAKTTFASVFGRYSGKLDPATNTALTVAASATWLDPFTKVSSSVYYEEVWQFTLTEQTNVVMMGYANSTFGNVRIRIHNSAPAPLVSDPAGWGTLPIVTDVDTGTSANVSGRPANLSVLLNAGTYYVRVSRNTAGIPSDSGTNRYYDLSSNVPLSRYEYAAVYQPTGFTGQFNDNHSGNTARGGEWATNTGSKIGTIPWAQIRVQRPASERRGVIQQSFASVRYGFMMYNADYKGRMMVGCNNSSLCTLLAAFDSLYPFNGTPTGEALREAQDYFQQSSSYSYYSGNSAFIGKGTVKDPYFEQAASGSVLPVPCRKSTVLLISDGEWNGSVDPVKPALVMHASDIRTDGNMPGQQSITVYAVYAFGDAPAGEYAMKATAAYGSFTDQSDCGTSGYPFGFTGAPGTEPSSLSSTWPNPSCNPSGTYDTTCCKEWDQKFDLEVEGDGLGKGLPDNFFKADSGETLAAAVATVLKEVMSQNASASAAATVAQQSTEGDFIVRGMFQAVDPEIIGRYLWYGHLEVFWPYWDSSAGKWRYLFEGGVPCFRISGTSKACWDGAEFLKIVQADNRVIFTATLTDVAKNTWANEPFPTRGTVATALATWNQRFFGGTPTAFPYAADLVDWVRGIRIEGLRTRTDSGLNTGVGDNKEWRLGDVVYSTPVVIGSPGIGAVSTHDPDINRFYEFRSQDDVFYRDRIVYVGANDGMLHAFRAAKWDSSAKKWIDKPNVARDNGIGEEVWAYIPNALLSELKYQTSTTFAGAGCVHRYMVDLSPGVWTVFIKSSRCPSDSGITDVDGRCWRNVLIGGLRGGGDVYFAIDVTDPSDPVVLWEYSVLKNKIVFDRSGNSLSTCQSCMASCGTLPETPCCDSACKPNFNTVKPIITDETVYQAIKNLPMAWSKPYVGRVQLPPGVDVPIGDPSTGGSSYSAVKRFFASDDYKPFNRTNRTDAGADRRRHIAFIGGAMRHFQDDCRVWRYPDPQPTTDVLSADRRFELFRPDLLAIDIETGRNFFRYWWPRIEQFYGYFPVSLSVDRYIPNAMSDPLVLDIWNDNLEKVGDDGLVDHVYVGDMTGRFYEIVFDFDWFDKNPVTPTTPNPRYTFGIKVNQWVTRTTTSNPNHYRANLQPITVQPVASFTRGTQPKAVHVIFGTGKYDDIYDASGLGTDDKTDPAKMSLYNLMRPLGRPTFTSRSITLESGTYALKLEVERMCPGMTLKTGPCAWTKGGNTGDNCCAAGCSTPPSTDCWWCLMDFTLPLGSSTDPAERVVSKGLIAGGYVWVTTFVPPVGVCDALGNGYLYILAYDCSEVDPDEPPITDPAVTVTPITITVDGQTVTVGWRVGLGAGVPSYPVLDSRGESVTIQMGSGTPVTTPVDLPMRALTVKGWRER